MIARHEEIAVIEIRCRPGDLTLTWENSSHGVFSALWLRDNDPANRDARTGQRLIHLVDLPMEPRLKTAEVGPAGYLTLGWEDGATSVFPLNWLRAFDPRSHARSRPTRMPWIGQPADAFAWCAFGEWIEDSAAREAWLSSVARDGLAFLRNVPVRAGGVVEVAERIGLIRETNSGRTFDVLSAAEPDKLATTSMGLAVHTEHPYRDPVPGFQLLHCLQAAGEGGASIFVDGMAVAEKIRARDAEAFRTLCQLPVPFRCEDGEVDLAAERTMIELDTQEQFRAIYYNDRSIAPLPYRGNVLKKYYAAYRLLAGLLREPAREVVCRLQAGDLVLLDNTRLLHGRTAISSGARHLQGCYVDPDGLYSTLAVLARKRSLPQ